IAAEMLSANAICAVTALFIVGMVWLRTRMHYARGAGRLSLTPAGRIYFVALAAALVSGWFAAPALGRALWPDAPVSATVTRVVWFLVSYYAWIPVHGVLTSRGPVVFRAAAR